MFDCALELVMSETFFAGLAEFYFTAPFGLEDLAGGDTARRVRVEDRVDHVTTPSLRNRNVSLRAMRSWMEVVTLCSDSMGA